MASETTGYDPEKITQLYEELPHRRGEKNTDQLHIFINKALDNPDLQPWLTLSVSALELLEDKLSKKVPSVSKPLKKVIGIPKGQVQRRETHITSQLLESELDRASTLVLMFMPAGTKFLRERHLPETSELRLLSERIREYYRIEFTSLGVERPCFPEVTFFTSPETTSGNTAQPGSQNSKDKEAILTLGNEDLAEGFSSAEQLHTLEEGLALHWSTKCAEQLVGTLYPQGKALYDRYVAEDTRNDSNLAGKRIFYEVKLLEKADANNSDTVACIRYPHLNDYQPGKELVTELQENIPNFLALVEQARIDGKSLALAKAVERKYGKGAYREMVLGTFIMPGTESNDTPFDVKNNDSNEAAKPVEVGIAGWTTGSLILVSQDINESFPDSLKQLQLYQVGMILAEEIYHATAPYMVHARFENFRPKFSYERRGMVYTPKESQWHT